MCIRDRFFTIIDIAILPTAAWLNPTTLGILHGIIFAASLKAAVLSSSSRKELEKFYEKDIAKTRSFLEQKQISNFPEWMNR